MSYDDLEKYIPFEEKVFRPGQYDAILSILESFIDDGNKYALLNAPVGLGKSLVGYVVAKYLEEHQKGKTYFCTGTKLLQDQYIHDFKDVCTIKGRSNFTCLTDNMFNCSNGMCQTYSGHSCDRKPLLKSTWSYDGVELPEYPVDSDEGKIFYGDKEFDSMYMDGMCEYWYQKMTGIMKPLTMLNYDYLISDTRFVQHLPDRDLLVCDEGHNIEKIIMRQLEVKFSPNAISKEVGFNFTECSTIGDWAIEMDMLAALYKDKMKSETDFKKKKRLQEKHSKFRSLAYYLKEDPLNWVFIKDSFKNVPMYSFKPITVSNYSNLIFNMANHVLIMSGTVLKQDIFTRDLGITDFEYIEIPSIIPSCNRPIIKSYAGSMARSSIDFTMPNMIAKIKMLVEKHKDEKGLISTYTYSITNRLQKALKSDSRFMFHNQNNKEEVFARFKKNKTNKILVSPVAFEGIDFPHDQARFHLIVKDPFPNLGDKQLAARDSIDYGYIFRDRCRVLSQAYGRCTRGPSDYSTTYLLDSRLESLLGPSTLVTSYFLEGLVDMRYEDTLVLTNDAYDRLTKDNKRKTHEFEREVELNILHDIEDGYNSLEKLHTAYKQFSSDSYKYIIPGVNRLLKHGAIEYK